MAHRFDTVLAPDWMYTKFEKTPEGFLKGRAVVCTTGVYEYKRADGSIVKELRLPEEVFAPKFLDSLKLKPLTLTHPTEMVNADNVKQYQIGTLGDNPSSPSGTTGKPSLAGEQDGYQFYNTDMYNVSIDMIIHDAEAVKIVEGGVRELSVGYECELEPATEGARWCGQTYDFIQRNIVANHVSIVENARSGDTARIRLDSTDAVLVHPKDTIKDEGDNMPELKIVKLDNIDYQAELEVVKALNSAQTKADGLQTSLDALSVEKTKIEAERDTLKDRADAAEAKVKELEAKKMDEAVIDAAVARRMKIMDAARNAEVEVKDGMSEIEIQKAVIVKVFPKANLDGKDVSYVDARFDGAVEMLSVEAENKADAETRKAGTETVKVDSAEEVVDSRKAREAYIANLKNGYKGEKK